MMNCYVQISNKDYLSIYQIVIVTHNLRAQVSGANGMSFLCAVLL